MKTDVNTKIAIAFIVDSFLLFCAWVFGLNPERGILQGIVLLIVLITTALIFTEKDGVPHGPK
jgi:hypothetical protein